MWVQIVLKSNQSVLCGNISVFCWRFFLPRWLVYFTRVEFVLCVLYRGQLINNCCSGFVMYFFQILMSVNRRVFVQTVIVLTMRAVMSARVTLASKQALTCDTVSVSILKLPYSRFICHKCFNVFRKNANKISKGLRWVRKGANRGPFS